MHISARLYTREFDFPTRKSLPNIQLMIATMPRSGSTAFCLELWRTGLLGAPLEYVNPKMTGQERRWKELLRHELKYWKALQRVRTGPNGVFSYKFFVHEYVEVLRDRPKLISLISPTHVVYLTREDKLAQAISYSKAIRSGAWFANGAKRKPCDYNEEHIQACMDALSRQEQAWEHVFEITGARPHRITYEEFVDAPGAVIQAIIEYAVPCAQMRKPLSIPELEIQRDKVSDNWKDRFLARVVCGEKSLQRTVQNERVLSKSRGAEGISGFVAGQLRRPTSFGVNEGAGASWDSRRNDGAGSGEVASMLRTP